MASGDRPAVEQVKTPDTLGEEGRAGTVANMLRTLQARRFNLDVEVTANGLDDNSPAPGASPSPTGKTPSVSEERQRIDAGEKRLVAEYADLLPKVRQVLGLSEDA